MLSVQNLQLTIAQKVLIEDLSIELTQPGFVAIIGHNGSGKTSLFRAFLNLLPYQGEIFLSSPPALLNQKNTIHFDIPVRELVVMGKFREKKFFESYHTQDFKEAETTLQELGILHLAGANMLKLSGGEQQLVWLAQLLLQGREIMLLDEPSQYLDVLNKKRVFDLIGRQVYEKGKTVLCITHDLLNLYSMNGYLLNLSAPQPKLEILSREVIDRHLGLLEQEQE